MVAHNNFPTRVIYELLSRVVAGVCLSGTIVNEQNVPTQYGGRPSEEEQQPCGGEIRRSAASATCFFRRRDY
jgi:hypothetical protein